MIPDRVIGRYGLRPGGMSDRAVGYLIGYGSGDVGGIGVNRSCAWPARLSGSVVIVAASAALSAALAACLGTPVGAGPVKPGRVEPGHVQLGRPAGLRI